MRGHRGTGRRLLQERRAPIGSRDRCALAGAYGRLFPWIAGAALARGPGLAAPEGSGQLGPEVAPRRHFPDTMATVEEAMKVRGQHKRECQHQ